MFYKETNFRATDVGVVPTDWRAARLGDLSNDIFYGITAKAVEKKTGLRMLRTTDIVDYQVDWESLPCCEITEKRSKVERYLLRKNDLVIARAGTTGVSVLVKDDLGDTVFGSYLIKAALKQDLNPKFAHYFCQSQLYWHHIMRNKAGSTLKNISLPTLISLGIPLPSISEQVAIAEILASVDEAIQKTNEVITKTERLKRGLDLRGVLCSWFHIGISRTRFRIPGLRQNCNNNCIRGSSCICSLSSLPEILGSR